MWARELQFGEMTELTEDFILGLLPHRAGIQHDDVRLVQIVRLLQTVGGEKIFDLIGIVHRHLAAPRQNREFSRFGSVGDVQRQIVTYWLFLLVFNNGHNVILYAGPN
jgi:hypothetical protein